MVKGSWHFPKIIFTKANFNLVEKKGKENWNFPMGIFIKGSLRITKCTGKGSICGKTEMFMKGCLKTGKSSEKEISIIFLESIVKEIFKEEAWRIYNSSRIIVIEALKNIARDVSVL